MNTANSILQYYNVVYMILYHIYIIYDKELIQIKIYIPEYMSYTLGPTKLHGTTYSFVLPPLHDYISTTYLRFYSDE